MRDLSGTGQVYRFTLSQLLKSRANRVTLIIMMLLAAVSMPLTALLGGETPETSDTAGLASVRVDNRTDLGPGLLRRRLLGGHGLFRRRRGAGRCGDDHRR